MPLINGTYQTQPLGSPKDAQNFVFGDYTRKDMNDYSQAAYNYLMQQQQQAFEVDMWNAKNRYDSPAEQMKRYQDAGLNPFLIYGQQNQSGNIPQGTPAHFQSSGTMAKGYQNAMNTIAQVNNTLRQAAETFDYLTYGRSQSAWNLKNIQETALSRHLSNEWNELLLTGPSSDPETRSYLIGQGPRFKMYQNQQQAVAERINQLKAAISLIPDQRERMKALTALEAYRLQILRGQNDALLNIDTGNDTVDSWLKSVALWFKDLF